MESIETRLENIRKDLIQSIKRIIDEKSPNGEIIMKEYLPMDIVGCLLIEKITQEGIIIDDWEVEYENTNTDDLFILYRHLEKTYGMP